MGWEQLKQRLGQWKRFCRNSRLLAPVRYAKRKLWGWARGSRIRGAAGPLGFDFKTLLPPDFQLGRGQAILVAGWLHFPDLPPRSAVLAADGLEGLSPISFMGHGHCPL